MSVAQQDYAQYRAFFNGSPAIQVTSLDFEMDGALQPVNLLTEGLGGWTSGTGMVTFVVGIVVPIGGTEFDFDGWLARKEYVTAQFFCGRKSYNEQGKFTNVKLTHSQGDTASGTVTWQGPLKAFE